MPLKQTGVEICREVSRETASEDQSLIQKPFPISPQVSVTGGRSQNFFKRQWVLLNIWIQWDEGDHGQHLILPRGSSPVQHTLRGPESFSQHHANTAWTRIMQSASCQLDFSKGISWIPTCISLWWKSGISIYRFYSFNWYQTFWS